jgi:hypothetical protein
MRVSSNNEALTLFRLLVRRYGLVNNEQALGPIVRVPKWVALAMLQIHESTTVTERKEALKGVSNV